MMALWYTTTYVKLVYYAGGLGLVPATDYGLRSFPTLAPVSAKKDMHTLVYTRLFNDYEGHQHLG